MNAKEYLMQYKRTATRLKVLEAEIRAMRTEAESISIKLDGMPKGSNKGTWENIAVTLADRETEYQREYADLWKLRMQIIETLGKLSSKHQQLLYSKYIQGKTWEHIAVDMDITWRHCYRLHGSALVELDKVLKQYKMS